MENKKVASNVEIYLITQLILEYRVSLEDISKTFNKDKNELYNNLMKYNNESVQKALKYVLDYENGIVSKEEKEYSRKQVRLFLMKFSFAKDKDEKVKIINSLNHDKEVMSLRTKKRSELTNDDLEKISRYRLKYAMSRKRIEEYFAVTEDSLRAYEKTIQDTMLKQKLEILNNRNNLYNKPSQRKR